MITVMQNLSGSRQSDQHYEELMNHSMTCQACHSVQGVRTNIRVVFFVANIYNITYETVRRGNCSIILLNEISE